MFFRDGTIPLTDLTLSDLGWSEHFARQLEEGDAPARIETRTWPATLTIAYEGTPLSTRSSGTWACGN